VLAAGTPPLAKPNGDPPPSERFIHGSSMPAESLLVRDVREMSALAQIPDVHVAFSSIVGVPLHNGGRQVG
jgi:hypothetical protein